MRKKLPNRRNVQRISAPASSCPGGATGKSVVALFKVTPICIRAALERPSAGALARAG